MSRGGPVQHVPIGQCPFLQITIGSAQEIVRFAHGRGKDPLARLFLSSLLPDAFDDVAMVLRVGQIDQRVADDAEMEEVRMRVHEARHDRAASDIQVFGSRAGHDPHCLGGPNRCYAAVPEDDRLLRRGPAVQDEDGTSLDQQGLGRIGFGLYIMIG